eukprot:m.360585 g.360585  ORF g.360585 m.360585 type:complete len:499 (+) comp19095_c0_seq1:166-1662(+)
MSLHDQLLADLDDDEDDYEETLMDGDNDEDSDIDDAEEIEEVEEVQGAASVAEVGQRVEEVAKLADSEKLQRILRAIEEHSGAGEQPGAFGPLEADPEYMLTVEANNIIVDVDNEIGVAHKYIRDQYEKRFPELEQLVHDPVDYAKTVKLLQNGLDVQQDALKEVLQPATIMVVSVSATTTQGNLLSDSELRLVLDGCAMLLRLDEYKQRLFAYVESRMLFLAPNVAHICGASVAAKLLGVAGGLTALSKMPACNILLLGSQKKTLSGFSAAATLPHTGIIYYSDLVQAQPPAFRKKCARLVSAKMALAARVDSYRDKSVDAGATVGISLREEIEKKIEKAQEPPPAKAPKPLARPDDPIKKRRGGKRFRAQKEKYAQTEAKKAANRMGFGDLQEDVIQEEMGGSFSRGSMAKGRLRTLETKQRGGQLTRKMQKRLQRDAMATGGMSVIRGSSMSGTSSVSFTPLQGLEIVTPHLNKEKSAEAKKYFGTSSTFVNVGK